MLPRLAILLASIVLFAGLRPATPVLAVVHLAEISEVMAGFDGDPNVQFVEVNMLLSNQNITNGAKLATFDATGAFIDVDTGMVGDQPLLVVPSNVPNAGGGVRWLMGTSAFETASGLQADFVFPPSPGLPTSAGMVCLFENGRDFTDPSQSIDCVAYGGAAFTGTNPNSFPSEAATVGPGDGLRSLTRINSAEVEMGPPWARSNDAEDFALRCPTPENNAGEVAMLGVDDDSDGLPNCHEAEQGTDPTLADTDADGCLDGTEVGEDATLGGGRDPTNFWDFFDPTQDGAISVLDFFALLERFGAEGDPTLDPLSEPSDPPAYHPRFDRSTVAEKLSGPADGAIALPDFFLLLGQFGHSCA